MAAKTKGAGSSVFFQLTRRHFIVFFKNKISVLYTLLVPIIIFVVYIFFLRSMEMMTRMMKSAHVAITMITGMERSVHADITTMTMRNVPVLIITMMTRMRKMRMKRAMMSSELRRISILEIFLQRRAIFFHPMRVLMMNLSLRERLPDVSNALISAQSVLMSVRTGRM